MIKLGSFLNIVDNTGAQTAKCIRIKRAPRGTPGFEVLVTIKRYNPKKKPKKGNIYTGLIVRIRDRIYRRSYNYVAASYNGIVLLSKKEKVKTQRFRDERLPLAKRIFSSVALECRQKGYSRVILMSGRIF